MSVSILIVDDDKLLVQKLYETINWKSLEIDMVFTACNIRQAQKLLEEYPIDLLLSDIDMPQGNGLELLEWVRDKKLDVECAFLSSYANFAYAQMALKLSSKEYLLKPISNSDLEYALSKLVAVIKDKKKNTDICVDNRREKLWKEILLERFQERERLEKAVEEGLYREDDRICMDIIRIWEVPSGESYKKDIALYDFVVNNIASEFFRDGVHRLEAVIRMTDLEWMLVFRLNEDGGVSGEYFETMKKMLDKGFIRQCFVYVGKADSICNAAALRDSLEEMERCAVPDDSGILMEENWKPGVQHYRTPPWETWEKEMLRSDKLLSTEESIMNFVVSMKGECYLHAQNLKRFVHELVQMLYMYLNDQGITFEQIFDSLEYESYEKAALFSMSGLRTFIHYILEKLEGNRQNDSRQESIIVQLKEYIEQHLSENLSRTVLAKNVYLSEDYISKVFVKMTGMSIPNYIAARRVEKAKEYIRNSSLPISKIALEVGYSNFSYFSKTFRDLVGCTPNEYRNRMNSSSS